MPIYLKPDLISPLDTEKRIKAVPPGSTVKGIFFGTALDVVQKQTGKSIGRGHYNAMANYPVTELIEVLAQAAQLAYPGKTDRDSLRLLGHEVFPRLRNLPAGSFIFSTIGTDIVKGFTLVKRFYNLLSQTKADVTDATSNSAVIHLSDAWTFPTCYHLGVFEGSIATFGKKEYSVSVLEHNLCDVDLKCEWK